MARNVEIKAYIDSIAAVLPKALTVATAAPVEIQQDDTFFQCANGRLKLRAFDAQRGELIFYSRANQAGPKESFYLISTTTQPQQLREVLAAAHGVVGRVIKHRTLVIAGRTRIHLDRVENLGEFLELEVVLEDGETSEAGMKEAYTLMQQLGVGEEQLIEGAYVDLLAQKP
ncbi:class IV adenylate cyclase [Paenalcaligenes sp. Me52]|uniref:class IV adenylate cyclase n=1 Tax=Paenalcaligenes sp. Me52 TaxID=3392038 RepID=UPI003D28CD58